MVRTKLNQQEIVDFYKKNTRDKGKKRKPQKKLA
jgi:hypothetical protein